MMQTYNAGAVEVPTGLESVRRHPGMYTDTIRPSHLGQGVISNSADKALAGHTKRVGVILHADQFLEVIDDGHDMPVDIRPKEGVPVIELILCRLHAGGKFPNKNYQFSGGLHGVGISVVSALSEHVEVNIRRNEQVYNIAFENDDKVRDSQVVGIYSKCNTGTSVHFWPDESFFSSPCFSISCLMHVLKAKAVLCPGVETTLKDEANNSEQRWCYQDDLNGYLSEAVNDLPTLPKESFIGNFNGETEMADQALLWLPEDGGLLIESYVNLIPTMQGGTHVNGLRQGLLDAMHEFCEYRNILPCGAKLSAEDIWDCCVHVLSVKMQDPQLAGQTKERLSSRQCATFVPGMVRGTFNLRLNRNVQSAGLSAEMAISSAQRRLRAAKKAVRKRLTSGPALPGKLVDYITQGLNRTELSLVEGNSAGGSARQARDHEYQATVPLKGKILNTWEVSSDKMLASQEVHDVSVAISIDPDSGDLNQLRYGKICISVDADSDGLHIATLLCTLFTRHFRTPVKHSHVYVVLPPLYCINFGKGAYYALAEKEKAGVPEQLKRKKGKPNVQRFKGLSEMNPMQLRETTLDPSTCCLMQLVIDDEGDQCTNAMMDMLLIKKRSEDCRNQLQERDDLTDPEG